MLITRTSPLTGKTNSLELDVTPEQFHAWENGKMLQDAFSNLTPDEREFIFTGYTKEDWAKIFPESEDGEETLGRADALTFDSDFIEESTPQKDDPPTVEKKYSPPSGKIYSTKNIAYHKFHKVRPVYKYLNQNIYLAGGSLRTVLKCSAEDVCDFDLFFKNLDEVQPLYDRLLKDGWVLTYSCPDGFLYSFKRGKHKIQLICEVEYSSPHELLNSFDMSACYFCWHEGAFYFTREAVRSVFTKKLRVNNVSFPVATLKRLVKYANKGYNLGEGAEDFCRLVSQGNIDSWDFRHYID